MPKKSAGIVLYRINNHELEVFLVHPGGPFFQKKDIGVWSIPKGEYEDDEDPLTAAIREFGEETGVALTGEFVALSPIRQKSGKIVSAWAIKGDIDVNQVKSNTFKMKWPPGSTEFKEFAEIDKGAWFSISVAKQKINPAQTALIEELARKELS